MDRPAPSPDPQRSAPLAGGQSPAVAAPPSPSRVRLVRPSLYRSEATGSLAPDVRDLLVGACTMADDEGWLVWRPGEVAATLYPYAPSARRLRDLERRAALLEAAGLLVRHECGCCQLPTLKADHAVKGGVKSAAVWGWHHANHVALRIPTDSSVSDSGSDSGSVSVRDSGSGSSRAREGLAAAVCRDCRQPSPMHLETCPVRRFPQLAAVSG